MHAQYLPYLYTVNQTIEVLHKAIAINEGLRPTGLTYRICFVTNYINSPPLSPQHYLWVEDTFCVDRTTTMFTFGTPWRDSIMVRQNRIFLPALIEQNILEIFLCRHSEWSREPRHIDLHGSKRNGTGILQLGQQRSRLGVNAMHREQTRTIGIKGSTTPGAFPYIIDMYFCLSFSLIFGQQIYVVRHLKSVLLWLVKL